MWRRAAVTSNAMHISTDTLSRCKKECQLSCQPINSKTTLSNRSAPTQHKSNHADFFFSSTARSAKNANPKAIKSKSLQCFGYALTGSKIITVKNSARLITYCVIFLGNFSMLLSIHTAIHNRISVFNIVLLIGACIPFCVQLCYRPVPDNPRTAGALIRKDSYRNSVDTIWVHRPANIANLS